MRGRSILNGWTPESLLKSLPESFLLHLRGEKALTLPEPLPITFCTPEMLLSRPERFPESFSKPLPEHLPELFSSLL
ncbi:MAG: hypothetical protein ACK4XM_12515, partial [Chloroherpetonaceae bacterium]